METFKEWRVRKATQPAPWYVVALFFFLLLLVLPWLFFDNLSKKSWE